MECIVTNLLNKRIASRSISEDVIPEYIILELIESIRLTPSCYNKQPWRFIFLESTDALAKGAKVLGDGNRTWASRVPLLIIGYARKTDDCMLDDGRAYYQFDLGMSVMNLMLAATEHNLIARPMAGFDPRKVCELFGLEEDDEPMVMVAVGYRSEDESYLPEHLKGLGEKPRQRLDQSLIVNRFKKV